MSLTDEERENLIELANSRQLKKLKEELLEMNEVDIAELLGDLPPERALVIFRLLPKDLSSDVFASLEIEQQQHIINSIEDKELNSIIEDLAIDDAVDMVEELPASVVKRILKNATPDTRKLINEYLQYPDNTAGSIMTAEYVALRPSMTVEEAFAYIRKNGVDKETIYTCYVINPSRKLEGVVTLKDLIMHPYETRVEEIMDDNVISAFTTDDQEEVAALFNKYDFLALPVVDRENRLVGIVTIDDVMDVMEQEATEDFEKMAAMAPSERSYLKTSVFELAKNRSRGSASGQLYPDPYGYGRKFRKPGQHHGHPWYGGRRTGTCGRSESHLERSTGRRHVRSPARSDQFCASYDHLSRKHRDLRHCCSEHVPDGHPGQDAGRPASHGGEGNQTRSRPYGLSHADHYRGRLFNGHLLYAGITFFAHDVTCRKSAKRLVPQGPIS